ncbi:MAG: pyridoxal phosphate-dependent aminotransferase family protein [Planctomycetes bacterium]|nr:pyridoxal phosphate-dependent aminotransferase family protein [Planctomycetota bacterium]
MAKGVYPYFRAIGKHDCTRATIHGREVIMIGSNNYLGLTHDPRVIQASIDATNRYGTSCTGSRFLNGTLELHETLEDRLARFMGMESAAVFSTGFMVNLGVLAALVGKGDVVFCDRENHASIIDGARLAFGETRKYRHNDLSELERMLVETPAASGKLIVVDGVFSMNGTISDLPGVVRLAKKYGARVMVDDAHGIGVLGARGRGTAEHFNLLDDPNSGVDLVMGTFSKSLASIGGFIAGRADVVHYVKHTARALIFSASPTPANTAAALAALTILEEEPWRMKRLHEISSHVRNEFAALGYDTLGSQTPIVPVLIGSDEDTFAFWKMLDMHGVFANPVVAPGSPVGKGLIRTSYMATHRDEDITQVIEVFAKLMQQRKLPLSSSARA